MIIRLKQILNSFWVQYFIKNHSGFNRFCGTSPPLNATLLQSFSNLFRFGKYSPCKPAQKYNFRLKFGKIRRGKTSQSCDVRRFPSPITSPFLGHALTFVVHSLFFKPPILYIFNYPFLQSTLTTARTVSI